MNQLDFYEDLNLQVMNSLVISAVTTVSLNDFLAFVPENV